MAVRFPTTRHTPFQRYLTTVNTDTSFATFAGIIATTGTFNTLIPFAGYRGIEFIPFGTGADNAVLSWRIYTVFNSAESVPNSTEGAGILNPTQGITLYRVVNLFASGDATLSTVTGAAGALLGASDRAADTVTCSLAAGGTYMANLFGGADEIYAPANNDYVARVGLLDLGNPDFVMFDFLVNDGGTNTATGANVLFRMLT